MLAGKFLLILILLAGKKESRSRQLDEKRDLAGRWEQVKQFCTAKVVKLKVHVLQLLNVKSHNIMSLLRDIKLMSGDRIFLSCDKIVDLTGFHHDA